MVMNGTLSGFLISGLFSFKVSFLGIDLALEIWLFTTHFNLPDHSNEDMTLIPLELQPTLNTARRKAREAYLIHRGQTLEPSGMNRRNER